MSSSDRRAFLAFGLAALAGCGFTPVHGPGGTARGLRGRITVDPPRDRLGFKLVDRLETRLGQPQAATHNLSARIALSEQRLGITSGEVSTRRNVRGRVSFTLRDLSTGGIVTSGQVQSFTSYSTTDTPFATQTAQEDAFDRLMIILADELVARLLATSGDWLA